MYKWVKNITHGSLKKHVEQSKGFMLFLFISIYLPFRYHYASTL